MKKSIILTVALLATVSTTGCRCMDWLFRRGAPCVQQPACCTEMVAPCDTCNSCTSGPVLTPTPTEIRPGPAN